MIRVSARILRFNITVARIDNTVTELKKNPIINFHPIVGIKERKLGACILNQPSNQNILSQEFLDEFYRFLLSYQWDNSVDNVWIQSKFGVFSHGIDFKSLYEDPHYLDKACKLALLLAKLNKPTFAHANGSVKGAGAYLLSMMNVPFGSKQTSMQLDEVQRGLIPLMGGTHRLARMPLKIGYYLALTGDTLNVEEMSQLGLIKGNVFDNVSNGEVRQKIYESNLFFRNKFKYFDFDENDVMHEQEEKLFIDKKKIEYNEKFKESQANLLTQPTTNFNIKFAVNQHLAASVDYENTMNPYNSFTKNEDRNINNYFKMRLEKPLNYLTKHHLIQLYDVKGLSISRLDLVRIQQIFSKNTLEEVVEQLKNENQAWAQKAYENITQANPLAAKLTFKLLQKAQQLSWIQCVEAEYSVMRRLIQNSKIHLKSTDNTSSYEYINKYTGKSVQSVPKEVIQSYFARPKGFYRFQHDFPSKSLHPYCDYFEQLPDSVRTYLNRQKFIDKHLTEQQFQVVRFLNGNEINYNSKVYDVKILREKVFEKIQIEKDKERLIRRLEYYAANDHHLHEYLNKRVAYLQGIEPKQIEESTAKYVKELFQNKFNNKFQDFRNKTANIIGLQNKISFFKGLKNIILNNIIYNGHQYQRKKKGTSEFNGLIYFDSKGKDVYNSVNPHFTSNEGLNQLSKDFSKGLAASEKFQKYEKQEMPKFFATKDLVMDFERKNQQMWQKIKFKYNERPQLWAEAYTYKQLIEQASRTSEQLGGYLDWTYENFYDLLNNRQNPRLTYGDLSIDMVNRVKEMRAGKIEKLKEVEEEHKKLTESKFISKLYEYKDQQKMREVFPYYVNETTIPGEFRRSFLSILDSTLRELTSSYNIKNKSQLLLKEEFGVLDRWINKQIATQYTDKLKHDVEYVSSYLQILFVKEMLVELIDLKNDNQNVKAVAEIMKEKFNVDFYYKSSEITIEDIEKKIITFLYFLADMHTHSKANIKSPQSKLIDFMNRLKLSYEKNDDRGLPYSLEGLILLIGRDRKKIYSRYLGQKYVSDPEYLLDYVNKSSKLESRDFYKRNNNDIEEVINSARKDYFYQNRQTRGNLQRLVQNYFFYMMQFEQYIHKICGKQNFIPQNFINKDHKQYNNIFRSVVSPKNHEQWLADEIKAVIEQIFEERFQVQKKLTKGQLYIYDKKVLQQLSPANISQLIKNKLTEQIFLVKNMFGDKREQYDFKPTKQEEHDELYTRFKRTMKNPQALRKLNNMTMAENVFNEYMRDLNNRQNMLPQQKRFSQAERQFYRNGFTTRLPSRSYHRMTRDLFIYPEDMVSVPKTAEEIELLKKTNIKFSQSLSGEKIELSSFTKEYKNIQANSKDQLLDQMVEKIRRVESL